MKNQYEEKIEIIDNLIENELEFEKYIKNMEELDICLPENLNSEIYKKLNISDNVIEFKKGEKVFKNAIDIFKIVACTVFALAIWNTAFTQPLDVDTRIIKDEKVIDNIDMKMREINNRLNNVEEERNDL